MIERAINSDIAVTATALGLVAVAIVTAFIIVPLVAS